MRIVALALVSAAVAGPAGSTWAADEQQKPADSQKPAVIYEAPKKDKKGKQKQEPIVVSATMKALQAAQAALEKEQWDDALAQLKTAQATAGKTPLEDYQIDEMLGYTYAKKSDFAESAAAFEHALDSGQLPADKTEERIRLLAQLYSEARDYPKAIEFGERWLQQEGSSKIEVQVFLGRAHYFNKDYQAAAETMEKAIETARSEHQPLKENWLQVQFNSYVDMNDTAGVATALERLAVEFPKKRYWLDLFNVMKRERAADERTLLNIFRLMSDAGLLASADDYLQMAQIATKRVGVPGEAITVLEEGKAKKLFVSEIDVERCRQLLQEAKTAAQADRKTLPMLEQEAVAAKTGEADVQLGIAYQSYGQFEKGVEALQRGLQKGGLKRPDEAQLMLGRTLFKLNRQADAKAAFERVTGSPKLGTVAKLWLVYINSPAGWLDIQQPSRLES